jgi:hypothetical protein
MRLDFIREAWMLLSIIPARSIRASRGNEKVQVFDCIAIQKEEGFKPSSF